MDKYQDLIGMKFGRLTVLQRTDDRITKSGYKEKMFLCRCDCGAEKVVQSNNLKSGHTTSCGCAKHDTGEKIRHDLTGMKFNRLTVIRPAESSKTKETRWICRCDCGKEVIVQSNNLKSGQVKSCGCYRHEKAVKMHTKHGSAKRNEKRERLYSIWAGMKSRCYGENEPNFHRYGGRGIAVCDEWKDDFSIFRDWAINNGYSPELTIDRIDNSKGYSPDNCRWATSKEQALNRRSNRIITFNGETHSASEWEEILGFPRGTISRRIKKFGWTIDRALTEPIHTKNIGGGKNERREIS